MKNALKQEVAPEPPSVNDKSHTRTQQPVALRGQQLTNVIGGERPQQQLIQVSEGLLFGMLQCIFVLLAAQTVTYCSIVDSRRGPFYKL